VGHAERRHVTKINILRTPRWRRRPFWIFGKSL